jgi:hypothetical protein
MPNLEHRAVTDWMFELRSVAAAQEWPPAIRALEAAADHPEQLVHLGRVLDDLADQQHMSELGRMLRTTPLGDTFTAVLAQLGAARLLRILHWLPEAGIPECKLVIAALVEGSSHDAQAIRAALAALTRRAVLRRIFDPERIALLSEACAIALKETA